MASPIDERLTMWRNRLVKNQARLLPWRKREDVSCYRAYDKDIPELPFKVDVFGAVKDGNDPGGAVVLVAYAPRHGGGAAFDAFVDAAGVVAADVFGVDVARVFVQRRDRERGGEVHADDADASALTLLAREGAARFELRLGARRDPGLFLDHRTTRRLVAEACRGGALLNLFAYTGSFSVQAALGGATSTTSVDLSKKTTEWAAANLAHNGLVQAGESAHAWADLGDLSVPTHAARHRVVCGDVFAALAHSAVPDGAFDVVVVDPPSFSRSKRADDFEVQRDHPRLLRAAWTKVRAGGSLWFSTNLAGFTLNADCVREFAAVDVVVDDVTARTRTFDVRAAAHHCFCLRARERSPRAR